MKHLILLKANRIQNTSTSVYEWIEQMPATDEQNKWLKQTYDALYEIEQEYVLDASTNDDKETREVLNKATERSSDWYDLVIELHDQAEPSEDSEDHDTPDQKEDKKRKEVPPTQAPMNEELNQKLKGIIGENNNASITKAELINLGYKGVYPKGSSLVRVSPEFTIKRVSRSNALRFTLSRAKLN